MSNSPYFPSNLRALRVWVLWRLEERDGRTTKVPYSANYEGRASSTNPDTWSTFTRALRVFQSEPEKYRGLGVMVSKAERLIFVDIDHCIDEDGELDERGQDALEAFPETYIEKSQSGSGIHILAFGEIPRSFKNSTNGVEMYSEKRFCAMTGDAINGVPLSECPSALAYFHERYKSPDKRATTHALPRSPVSRSDSWIIKKASEHGRFALLYAGQWESAGFSSRSEADFVLCCELAFWTDADPEKIDALFRSSGLYREKWCRDDYREATISKACSYVKKTLSEYVEEKEQERRERFRERGLKFQSAFLSNW